MMRYINFLLVIVATLLSSCTKVQPGSGEMDGESLLKIDLSVDGGLEMVSTKSETEEDTDDEGENLYPMDPATVPAADDVYIELYRYGIKAGDKYATTETWNRLYCDTYANARTAALRVNAGRWKMVASHGSATACGFNKPYFFAEEEFVVDGGLKENGEPNITSVDAVVKVSNVRIRVNFDESVPGSFYDYFVRFSNMDESMAKYKQILRYKKGETRDAYMMPTDNMKIEFMAQYEYGDENSWRYQVIVPSLKLEANDFLIVNLSVDPRNGRLNVSIEKEDVVVKEPTTVEIEEIWAPQDAPKIEAAGFVNNDHAVVEGDNTGNAATLSVVARAGLKNFYVTMSSEYLSTLPDEAGIDLPLGEEIDLVNLDDATAAKLAAAGFEWNSTEDSRTLNYLKMTDFFTRINNLNPSLEVERNIVTFNVRVVDNVDSETSKTYTATAYPITQELSVPIGRVWANKIVSPQVKITRGVGSLFMLQVSTDGETWSDLTDFSRLVNSTVDYGTLDVNPNTTYHFRSVYNENSNLISNVVTVTTESALQVGNPGFEDYHSTIMEVSPLGWIYDYERTWYLPYKENETDKWWAVNSKKTMPDGHTAWTSNWCKNFPCTAFSTDSHSGEKSAMVYTVNVGDGNTDGTAIGTNVPGEIWIGTADNSGNHSSDGHAFASRPQSLKFWYKYQPQGSETFVATIVLKDAAGNEIARGEKNDGGLTSEWTQCELPIVYSNLSTKAASLYISFKACASGSVNAAATIEVAGNQETIHAGAVLRVDDIELTY